MKKLVVCLVVLAALLIPAMVLADSADASGWPVYPPPRCEEEVQTWYRHGKDWYRSGEGPMTRNLLAALDVENSLEAAVTRKSGNARSQPGLPWRSGVSGQ